MPTPLHHVKAAKDYFDASGKKIISKGQMYYWWKFKNRDKQRSLIKPSSDQLKKYGLTEFETNTADYDSRKRDLEDYFDEDEKQSLIEDVENYKSELEDRLSNIPDAMQEASVLNEYIETLDELISDINNVEGEDE